MDLTAYPRTPRLVNRFFLGADPEFVFTDIEGRYIHAEKAGMTTLQAFGCDMSGRQAEIRAYPSRFALEVVASVMDALRWMSYAHGPVIDPLSWVAVAYNGKDGCGGHIHIGRKRPDRQKEVGRLDRLTEGLLRMGVLSSQPFILRRNHTNYGRYGDSRLQSHGYEYRTLPTALANPWLSYFVMVACKLTVYEDENYLKGGITDRPSQIMGLFDKYKYLDDDAAICVKALKVHGLPKDSSADFKGFWGIKTLKSPSSSFERTFFPSCIEPSQTSKNELFEFLTEGKAIPAAVPEVTWKPFKLANGFYKVKVTPHCLGHLHDVGMNLISKGVDVNLSVADRFEIYSPVQLPVAKIKEALCPLVGMTGVHFPSGHQMAEMHIHIPTALNKSREACKKLHTILADTTLFPVCEAKNTDTADWSAWAVLNKPSSEKNKPRLGKLIAEVKGFKPQVEVVKPPAIKKPLYRIPVDDDGF